MAVKKPKVRHIRATKGAELAIGEPRQILTMRTQYAVDRFGVYLQHWMREGQLAGIRKGLPKLVKLRAHIRDTQGKESKDYALVKETVERYVKLYREIRAERKLRGAPKYDPDTSGVRFG